MLNALLGWLRKPVKLPQRYMTCAELARRIAAGEKWRLVVCYDCRKRINPEDDDAFVCIQCGGRNRRLPNLEGEALPTTDGETKK